MPSWMMKRSVADLVGALLMATEDGASLVIDNFLDDRFYLCDGTTMVYHENPDH